MKTKDLIKKLQMVKPDSTVYLEGIESYYDFSGISVDDNNDVRLYIESGDPEA